MTRSLYIDDSWRGDYGIGRYSREVLSRLTLPWTRLRSLGNPGSPQNLLIPRLTKPNALIYSPGYNAAPTPQQQIVTIHDLIHLQEGSRRYRDYYTHVLRPAVLRSRIVFTVSETSARALTEWIDHPDVEIVVTGNGRSPAFTPAGWEEPGKPYVLFVGNLKPHKNLPLILSSIKQTNEVELVTVTPNPTATMSLANSLGVADRVRSLGQLGDHELINLYRGARATILPSLIEGFGLPALESVSCGTPVIYWAGCESVAEIVGTCGWAAVSSDDPTEWADLIDRSLAAYNFPAMTEQVAKFDWDQVASTVEEKLDELL